MSPGVTMDPITITKLRSASTMQQRKVEDTSLVATMLPTDILHRVFGGLPPSHRFVGAISRRFNAEYDLYTRRPGKPKGTYVYGLSSLRQLDIFLSERTAGDLEIERDTFDGGESELRELNDLEVLKYLEDNRD
uniref:Uncharacterized protein n=1 Tax=Corethron hystrix TaxID=216773 RepID=A0A7S1BJ09_9STRA|mmetsp:Transcript_2741/g.5169  ORF Transcript_2741/g.5169 Transcript_2741/m.5169 type:complete len:134 (+) Transcript_2741:68-469(+)